MSDTQDKSPSYGKVLALAAPAFLAKAVIGDLPKAGIEHAVESKVLGGQKNFGHYLAHGLKGKGSGRLLGGALGVATAPLFLKGTRLLQSKDTDERKKGYGLIAASTAAFAGSKGFLENFMGARLRGESPVLAATKGAFLGLVRSGYKVPIALAMAMGIAAGRKSKNEDGTQNKFKMLALPALAGAGAGSISRMIESGAEQATFGKRIAPAARFRKILGAGAGGAAGGLLGGLVLAGAANATEKLLRGNKEKKASVALTALAIGAAKAGFLPTGIGAAALGGAALKAGVGTVAHLLAGSTLAHALSRKAYGYKAPILDTLMPRDGRAHKALTNWATRARSRQFAMGIKEGLVGHGHSGSRSQALSNNLLIPEFIALRHAGNGLGRKLRDIPEHQRESYLRRVQKAVVDNPSVLKGMEGEHNPIMAPVFGGISMAIGDRGRYAWAPEGSRRQRIFDTLMYSGRGVSDPGLPTKLRELQKHPTKMRENLGNALGVVGAAGAALAGAPTGLVGHFAFNNIKPAALELEGIKVLGRQVIPNIKAMANTDIANGVYHGIFPGLGKEKLRDTGNLVKEYMVSPATTQMQRGLVPITTAMRDSLLKELTQKARLSVGGAIERAVLPKREHAAKIIAVPAGVGTGIGLAGYMALRNPPPRKKS